MVFGFRQKADCVREVVKWSSSRVPDSARRLLVRQLVPFDIDRDSALIHAERIAAVTHLVSGLEYLARPELWKEGGLNDWRIMRASYHGKNPTFVKFLDVVARENVTKAIIGAQTLAAVIAVSPVKNNRVRFVSNVVIYGSSVILNPRTFFGADGSDQASTLVQGLASIARGFGNKPLMTDSALWAMSIQSTMSYTVSGVAKVFGEPWRNATAIPGVARTLSYGHKRTWEFSIAHPRLTRAVTYAILALESSYLLVYMFGGRLSKAYIVAISGLHIGIGYSMALGRFIPAFCAMHPAVAYTARHLRVRSPQVLNNTLPKVTAIFTFGMVIAAVVNQNRSTKLVEDGWGDERFFVTKTGSKLAYRISGKEDDEAPLFIIEAGLQCPMELYMHLTTSLGQIGTVITSSRLGYGRSGPFADTDGYLAESIHNLVGLIENCGQNRPVVVIGHSLGGYTAMRAANEASDNVDMVVLLDGAHPEYLRRSPSMYHGARVVARSIEKSTRLTALGGSMFVDPPSWVRYLPNEGRKRAVAFIRNRSTWQTVDREWRSMCEEFGSGAHLQPVDCHVVGLIAETTMEINSVHGDFLRELVDLGSSSIASTVRYSDHFSLLALEQNSYELTVLIESELEHVLSTRGGKKL